MTPTTTKSTQPATQRQPGLRLALRPEMTIREALKRYPHLQLLVAIRRWPIDPARDGHLTLQEYAGTLRTFQFDTYLCSVNNIAVLFDSPDVAGDPTLVRFYGPRQPVVRDCGQSVPAEWDATTGIGRVMIQRGAGAGEFSIGTST